ncbi:poly(U)-specific 3'-to-5' RNA exonuclease [Coemansia sp. RSA 2336]|nr:poly(U)-specific 3'-to-5' RNA exonuclease [Coemansia sp. RSA 2336]
MASGSDGAERLVDYSSSDESSSGSGVDLGHVVGGWSGHIGLVIGGRSRQQLQQLGATYMQALGRPEAAQVIADPHISLTRAFYLQEHQIASFMAALEEGMPGGELTVGFGGPIALANEQGDRGFVGVQVTRGSEQVKRVLEGVNAVMRRFGKPEFFEDARFHVSVLRMDAKCLQRMRGMLGSQEIMSTRIDTKAEEKEEPKEEKAEDEAKKAKSEDALKKLKRRSTVVRNKTTGMVSRLKKFFSKAKEAKPEEAADEAKDDKPEEPKEEPKAEEEPKQDAEGSKDSAVAEKPAEEKKEEKKDEKPAEAAPAAATASA